MAYIATGPVTDLKFDEAITAADPHSVGQLGRPVITTDGSVLRLYRASGAVVKGALCAVDGASGDAAELSNSTAELGGGQLIGFAQATAADNQLFWLLTEKPDENNTDFVALAGAAMAADVQNATTATAGEIDDAVGVGTFDILGLHVTAAVGGAGTFSTFKTASGGMRLRDVAN